MSAAAPAKTKKTAGKAADKSEEPVAAVDVAPEHPMAKGIRGTGKVDLAILTGQFTRDESAGIDLMIVGDVNVTKAARFIEELEKSENKEIRYTVMPLSTYQYRVQINDRFINNVLAAKKQVIINNQDLLVEQ